MRIEIDSAHDGPAQYRAAAAAILMLAGDIPQLEVSGDAPAAPAGTVTQPAPSAARSNVVPFPPAPPAPSAPYNTSPISAPTAQPIPPLPVAPPAGPVNSVANAPQSSTVTSTAITTSSVPPVFVPPVPTAAPNNASPVTTIAAAGPVEYDSSGLPWDGRIHNKKHSKKQDGTWKLIKGLDPTVAQQVIQELSARRVAPHAGVSAGVAAMGVTPRPAEPAIVTWNPPPPQVQLPPSPLGFNGSVPLPPVPPVPAATMVPPPPPAYAMPGVVPGPAQVGSAVVDAAAGAAPGVSVAADEYRQLMNKLTAATRDKQLDPRLVSPVVQKHGAPNLMALGNPEYTHLIPTIDRDFDSLIAGLPVEGVA